MPTHALGAGTCNLCVNVRRPVHRALGRLAFCADMSMGAFVRWALARVSSISKDAALAESEDRMAAELLRRARADGLTAEDMPAIEEAISLISRSADRDRELHTAKAS